MASARLVPEKKPDVELTLTHEEAVELQSILMATRWLDHPTARNIYRAIADDCQVHER